jgi:hypothetical protein
VRMQSAIALMRPIWPRSGRFPRTLSEAAGEVDQIHANQPVLPMRTPESASRIAPNRAQANQRVSGSM